MSVALKKLDAIWQKTTFLIGTQTTALNSNSLCHQLTVTVQTIPFASPKPRTSRTKKY